MGLVDRDHRPARLVVGTAAVSSAGAVVMWILSMTGTWEAGATRDVGWAWGGSAALGAIVVSRLRRPLGWRLTWGVTSLAGSAVTAALVWHHAGRQTWPLGASALGFLAMVVAAAAVAAWMASDGVGAERTGPAATIAVTAAVVVVAAGVATSGWGDRPLASQGTTGALPSASGPPRITSRAWTTTFDANPDVVADANQLYEVLDGAHAGVAAIDPTTGRTRWTWTRPNPGHANPTVHAGSGAVVIEMSDRLAVLDARTGTQRFVLGDPFDGEAQLSIDGGELVAVRTDADTPHTITAVSLRDGHSLWSRTPGPASCGGSLPEVGPIVASADVTAVAVACSQRYEAGDVSESGLGALRLLLVAAGRRDRSVAVPTDGFFQPGDLSLADDDGTIIAVSSGVTASPSDSVGVMTTAAIDPVGGRVRWDAQEPSEHGAQLLGSTPVGVAVDVDSTHLRLIDPADGHILRTITVRVTGSNKFQALDGSNVVSLTLNPASRTGLPYALNTIDLATGANVAGSTIPYDPTYPSRYYPDGVYAFGPTVVLPVEGLRHDYPGVQRLLAAYR